MIFSRSPVCLNSPLFKIRVNSKVLVRHGANQYFSWCCMSPGQRLLRKYIYPKRCNGKICKVSPVNTRLSSCRVITTSGTSEYESKSPYICTVTSLKARLNSQEYILKKTVGTPKKAELLSFIPFDDEEPKRRKIPSPNSFNDNVFPVPSNGDINKKMMYNQKVQPTIVNSKNERHHHKPTHLSKPVFAQGTFADTTNKKDTMILNPYRPDLRTIIHFRNKNVEVIEPSTNPDLMDLANQHIMQLRKNNSKKPSRINFVRFDSSELYFNRQPIGSDTGCRILKRVESISLETPFSRYWIPNEEEHQISELFPGNDEINLICYEEKNDTIVTKVPIKKNTLIEESVVPSKSILDIINSIDTSTVIIQKDLYITSRIIQSIKDDEKNKDKKKLDTQGFKGDLKQDLILHFTIKKKDTGSIHELNSNMEGENLLYLPKEFSCSPESLFELLKGLIKLNTDGFHLLKTNSDNGTAEFFFSLLGKADLMSASSRDIIRRALGILEKEKFYQKKMREEQKDEKRKEDSVKGEITDKIFEKEKQERPKERDLFNFQLETSGDMILGNSHVLLASCSLPKGEQDKMPFKLNFPRSTSPEEIKQSEESTVSDDRDQQDQSFRNNNDYSQTFDKHGFLCNDDPKVYIRDGIKCTNLYPNNKYNNLKVTNRVNIKLAKYCPISKFHHANNIKQDDSFLESKKYENDSSLNRDLTNNCETNFKNKFHNFNNMENYVKYFNSLKNSSYDQNAHTRTIRPCDINTTYSFDFPSESVMLGSENYITNSSDKEFISHKDINFDNIYTNDNGVKSKVQVYDFIKAKYCITETCKTHCIRPREIRQVYDDFNDIDWNKEYNAKQDKLENDKPDVQKHLNETKDKNTNYFTNNKTEINSCEKQNQNLKSIAAWTDNSNYTQKTDDSDTGSIERSKKSDKYQLGNIFDVLFETEGNIKDCNSMDIEINEFPIKIDSENIDKQNASNIFDFTKILKNKKTFEAKYFNNNNYKQTTIKGIFEMNSLENPKNVIKKDSELTFINTKYLNYNNSGVKNSEYKTNRETYLINAYDISEILEKNTKDYNFIKDYYNDIIKLANSGGINNIEINTVNNLVNTNTERNLSEYKFTQENCNPKSKASDSINDIILSEKKDEQLDNAEEIKDSLTAKSNNIQPTNTCHNSNPVVENNFLNTKNDLLNLEPETISEELNSSECTFSYSSDVGNNKDPYSHEKSNNSKEENILSGISSKKIQNVENNSKNEEVKTENKDTKTNKAENNTTEPYNSQDKHTKFPYQMFSESSAQTKNVLSFIPCIEDNSTSSDCASLVDKSVMCLMSSQGKNGKREEVKTEKLNVTRFKKLNSSGSDIIKDVENSDHIKKTSINVTKKNDFTDINVSEKEIFTDPRIPVSFSTESTFQITGSNSSIKNEMQAFETATGALISSITETKKNKNILNPNLATLKIEDQNLSEPPNIQKKRNKKSLCKAYRMKQTLKNGKAFKKQKVGHSHSSKQFKVNNKKTIDSFKNFVEKIKNFQESGITSTKEKTTDKMKKNINMTEIDDKVDKSINNYVHLLEGSDKKHRKISNNKNQIKKKKVALMENKSLSKRDKIILREILKANKNKKKAIKPTKSKEVLKSFYKGLKNEKKKTNTTEPIIKTTPKISTMKGTKTRVKLYDPMTITGNQKVKTSDKSNQVPREKKSSSKSSLRDGSAETNNAIDNINVLKEIKETPLSKEKESLASNHTSRKSDDKQLRTSEKIEKTKLPEKKTEAHANQAETSVSGNKNEQNVEPKISTIESSKNADNDIHKEAFKKKLLTKVESKIESNSQINFRVGSKKLAKIKPKIPKTLDVQKLKLTSPESKAKLDNMANNYKGPVHQDPYSPKIKASSPPIKNTKSSFKPKNIVNIAVKNKFPSNIKVDKPLKKHVTLNNKMVSKPTFKQKNIKIKDQDDKQIANKKKLNASKVDLNVEHVDDTNKNYTKIEKNKEEKQVLNNKTENTSPLPMKPEPSASEKAVKIETKEEKHLNATNATNIETKSKMEIPVYVQNSKQEKTPVSQKPKTIIKEDVFPKLLVDLDKMTKEIKPKFSYKTSRICSIPLDRIKHFPIWNPKKNKVIEQPSTVIKVCPSKDSKLSKELARIPPVTKILNVTLHKETKDQLKTWWQVMTNKLGEKGFRNLYKGEMTSGSQFHNLIQDQLLWGGGGAIPSSPSFKSLQNVLKEVKDLCVINSHVIHNTLAYRGVVDCVAKYKKKPVVIEWKRMDNKEMLEEKALESAFQQLSAYVGAMNYDSNYDFQVKGGLLVLAYNDGTEADCFDLNEKNCENYWKLWLDRLQRYHIHIVNKKKEK